ncbi:hypothetical protein ACFL0Y_02280 [Patescibacteria group bacterium]
MTQSKRRPVGLVDLATIKHLIVEIVHPVLPVTQIVHALDSIKQTDSSTTIPNQDQKKDQK